MKWFLFIAIAYQGGDATISYDKAHEMPDKATCFEALLEVSIDLLVPASDGVRQGGAFVAYCAPAEVSS